MTFLKTVTWNLAYLALAGGIVLGIQGCSKKTFTALNNEDVQSNNNGANTGSGTANGGTGGGSTTAGTTSGGSTTSGTNNGGGSTTSGTTNGGGSTTSGTNNGGGSTTSGTTSGSTTTTPPTKRYCLTEKYVQPSATITRKLDVLIVTDSSSSMDDEREALANGINNYIARLPNGTNARFAVMLAHGPTSWFSGRLYKSDYKDPREKLVISTEDYSTTDIQKWLRRKLLYRQLNYSVRAFTSDADFTYMDPSKGARGLPTDYDADGGEAGLYTLYEAFRDYSEGPAARYKSIQALDTDSAQVAGERSFFRQDAALAVIFLADENDLCYPDSSVADPDNLEVPFYNHYCSPVKAESLLQRIQAIRQSLPLYISSVIYNQPGNIPAGLENGVGYGYNRITQLSNGSIIDITSGIGAIAPGLSSIGSYASSRLDLRYDFILKYQSVDSTTIVPKVDNTPTMNFAYGSTTNTVHIMQPGGANSKVNIRYCLNRGAPLTPYQVQISSYLLNKTPQTYQPDVVIETD
jgi:hypothetical protein